MKELVSQSKEISHEYCCTVVKIGEVKPIEGSDFLGQTLVNGLSIVVRKDMVKEGDYMFYAANETQLNLDFLSVNNQYEFSERQLNANADEVIKLYEESEKLRNAGKIEEADTVYNKAKSMVGFFGKNGRVKMIKLRGCPSMGYLFGLDSMITWCPLMKEFNMEENEGMDFDTVNGEKFICAYVPPIKENQRADRAAKRNKKLRAFDRMIPGQFSFHYDTQQLNREIGRIKPTDNVTISVKLHGTSVIIGNIKVKVPKFKGLYSKIFNWLPGFLQFTNEGYDVVYSSRTVIKNSKINSKVTSGFYGADVWATYYELLKDKIPEGMTIYGEIVGYVTDSNTMIQKGYDYKCLPGKNQLMIYRISQKVYDEELGYEKNVEWNVKEVYVWTKLLIEQYPELKDYIHPIDILYEGTLADLYPEISTTEHWHENVLEAMKNDTVHFGMEKNEPLCRNKTPREGIVLRINDDPINEAFKLKCISFLSKEAKMIDEGEVDIELEQGRY